MCTLIFWLCFVACGILVPRPGTKPTPPAIETWSLNHGTPGKSQGCICTVMLMGWLSVCLHSTYIFFLPGQCTRKQGMYSVFGLMSSIAKVVMDVLVNSACKKREWVGCSGIFSTNTVYHILSVNIYFIDCN